MVNVTPWPLYPRGRTRRLGEPQGRSGRARKILPPMGFDPRTVQPVASRYTDWAIQAPNFVQWHPSCMCPHCGTITLLVPRIIRWLVGFDYCVPLIQAVCWDSLLTKYVRCGHLQWDCHFSVAKLSRHCLLSWTHNPHRYDLSQE